MDNSSEIIFQMAKEVLQSEERNLDELRGRASAVLAGSAIGLGLLGQTLDFNLWTTWAGVVGLGSALLASLWILLPHEGWNFGFDIWTLEKDFLPLEPDSARHELVIHMGEMSDKNRKKMSPLIRSFGFSVIALATGSIAALTELGR
jgi:hypothetical protein